LRVLKLEISVHNVYITNQFQTTFCSRGRGGGGKKIRIQYILFFLKVVLWCLGTVTPDGAYMSHEDDYTDLGRHPFTSFGMAMKQSFLLFLKSEKERNER
jgi:hypothetical protein